MISKEQLADLVITNLSGGMQIDSVKFDNREFYQYISMGVSALINAELKPSKGTFIADGSWIKAYPDVPIKWDDSRKVCYFDLPCPIINIESDMGLYAVCPMEDESTQHIITKKGALSVFKNLEAAYAGPYRFKCYVEGDRVIYPEMPETYVDNVLLVTLIPDPTGLADNDPINVPGTMIDRLVDLIIALSKGQVTFRNKTANDQNPNT